jgi:hypothetical protein
MSKYERYGLNPAKILLVIRDGMANDWKTLCQLFAGGSQVGTRANILRTHLMVLSEVGLIEFDDTFFQDIGRVKITQRWGEIQSALGISLAEISELIPYKSMVVKPEFGEPSIPPVQSDIFVLMPFSEELRPVYDDHICKVANILKLTITRADDFFAARMIISDIWSAVCNSRLIIADCTGRNPNVFYEIGMSHIVGKKVILITQNEEDIPFDFKHIRYIKYDYTPRGMQDLERKLSETINYELSMLKYE